MAMSGVTNPALQGMQWATNRRQKEEAHQTSQKFNKTRIIANENANKEYVLNEPVRDLERKAKARDYRLNLLYAGREREAEVRNTELGNTRTSQDIVAFDEAADARAAENEATATTAVEAAQVDVAKAQQQVAASRAEQQRMADKASRDIDEYITTTLPVVSDMTPKDYRTYRKRIRTAGGDPDEMGLPVEFNDEARAVLRRQRKQAVMNVEAQREVDIATEKKQQLLDKGLYSEYSMLQTKNKELQKQVDDNPSDLGLRQEIIENNKRMLKLTFASKTEADVLSEKRLTDAHGRMAITQMLNENINRSLTLLTQDRTRAGFVGSIRAGIQQARGVATDFTEKYGGSATSELVGQIMSDTESQIAADVASGNLDPKDANELYRSFHDPALDELQALELMMSYQFARTELKPNDRLNTQDVKEVRGMFNTRGMMSADSAVSNLRTAQKQVIRGYEHQYKQLKPKEYSENLPKTLEPFIQAQVDNREQASEPNPPPSTQGTVEWGYDGEGNLVPLNQ